MRECYINQITQQTINMHLPLLNLYDFFGKRPEIYDFIWLFIWPTKIYDFISTLNPPWSGWRLLSRAMVIHRRLARGPMRPLVSHLGRPPDMQLAGGPARGERGSSINGHGKKWLEIQAISSHLSQLCNNTVAGCRLMVTRGAGLVNNLNKKFIYFWFKCL